MKVLSIDNVFVPVADLAEALRFYHDTLGLPVAKRFDDLGIRRICPGRSAVVEEAGPPASARRTAAAKWAALR
jgi:catechol 2,3-dioxygenase-like lactoylglutathione lyase family enzyme